MTQTSNDTTMVSNASIADALEEMAKLLELQAANPFRIGAYRKAAARVRACRTPLGTIHAQGGQGALQELPGIGSSLAKKIAELLARGRLSSLERLRSKEKRDALLNLPTIGPRLADRIRRTLDVHTLEDVYAAARDGRLHRIEGIGQKRVRAIRESLAMRLGAGARRTRPRQSTGAPIAELLDVDREYRQKTRRDRLLRVAPRQFNPTAVAWLPILRTRRNARRYSAHFTNTAESHRLGREHDWVSITCESKQAFGRWTVITAAAGPLAGKRIVQGREAECREIYARQLVQLPLPVV
jgi:DNA polymerase (family X)